MVDTTQLDAVLDAIERQYPGAVHDGATNQPVSRVSTGSLELDYATGGGVPIGRISHFWGGWSSGKSLTCWRTVRECQRMGMLGAYFNVEKQYDPVYVQKMGVDTKKLMVVDEGTIEGVGKVLESLVGVMHYFVIDSINAAVSIDELGAKLEDWQMALAPRAWGKVFRRVLERFDSNENLLIMVNHASGFGPVEKPPGGRFIEHLSSCTVHFKRGPWLFRDAHGHLSPDNRGGSVASLAGDVEPDGFEIVCRCEKSRVSRPLRPARMRYDFSTTSLDEAFEYAKAAKYLDVAKTTSAGRYEMPDGTKLHGEGKLRAHIEADAALRDDIRSKLLQQA